MERLLILICTLISLLPDILYPNTGEAGIIATVAYDPLTGENGGLRMSGLFSDHMVLQRDEPLVIQGIANAGDEIIVTIGRQKKETTTDASGKWEVILDPLSTGPVYTLEISSPSQKLIYKNVLAGEVWLCSGQSNMAFELKASAPKEFEQQMEYAATNPPVRFYDLKPLWQTNAMEWDISVMDSLNRLHYFRETTWAECNASTVSGVSAVAFAFARMLTDSLQVPVGLILNAVGGSPAEAWISRKTLEYEFPDILTDWTKNDFIQLWARERAMQNIRKSPYKNQRHPYEPVYLFEAGIEPLQHFPIRGVIWYQGESNAHNVEVHEKLFPLLVKSWRTHWEKEFPFYYVQLSSINRPSWPGFRDSQRRMMEIIPHMGMAVSSDRGDSLDVHPRWKKEIGERLARWALHKTYHSSIMPSGPLMKSGVREKNNIWIEFNYGEGLTTSDKEPLRTFEIASEEGLYYPAQALIEGNKIKVWNDQVQQPCYVRYGWQPFTRANLVNREGLPASTFRIEISHEH